MRSRIPGRRTVLVQVAALATVTLALGWIVGRIHPLLGTLRGAPQALQR